MKPLLLADDLRDQTSEDHKRSKVSRAWARFFSEKLEMPLQAATVVETKESAWENNMIHKSYSNLLSDAYTRDFEKRRLKKVAEQLRAQPLFIVGSPVNELLKLARGKRFQMMVLGTHGREGAKRLFLGSVSEEIVRQAEIPVCVLGPRVQKNVVLPPKGERMNIVVATDFGRGSRAAEVFAVKLAKKTGASITFVHCVYQGQSPMVGMALQTPEGQKAVADLFETLEKDMSGLMKKKRESLERAGIECKTFLDKKSASSYRSILKAIERDGGNIVVTGTHGRTLLGQAFFGSTARQTILRSPVPVIVVKSK